MVARIQDIFKNETAQGPLLAEQRAQKIAVAFGGTVERLSTAQTQQQWENRPLTTWSIDADRLVHHGFDMPVDLIGKQFASAELASEAVLSIIK